MKLVIIIIDICKNFVKKYKYLHTKIYKQQPSKKYSLDTVFFLFVPLYFAPFVFIQVNI